MRSYCAIYVDAGYLLASAATRVTGTSFRGGVTVDHAALVDGLVDQVEAASGLPLLRVNWYDSGAKPGGVPDAVQDSVGMLPRVKLRLGRLSPGGEQKGVDLRIGLDLATHGRNRVVDLVYLVSGDDDLTEAVEEAQGHGVQVILLAAPNQVGAAHNVSRHLQREADGLMVIDPAVIDATVRPASEGAPQAAARAGVRLSPPPATVPPAATLPPGGTSAPAPASPTPADIAARQSQQLRRIAPTANKTGPPDSPTRPTAEPPVPGLRANTDEVVDQVARGVIDAWAATAEAPDRDQLLSQRPYIPRDLDRALLVDLSTSLGVYDVDEVVRHQVRDRFWELMTDLPDTS